MSLHVVFHHNKLMNLNQLN